MIKIRLLTIAESAVIAKTTNKLSIFNIVDEIQCSAFPALVKTLDLVVGSNRDPKTDPRKCSLRLKISLGRKKLFEHPVAVDYESKSRSNLIIHLQGIAVREPGMLNFAVYLKKSRLAVCALKVIKIDASTIKAEIRGKTGSL